MPAAPVPVRSETLRELIAAGSVRSVTLIGQRGGFAVLVRAGLQERLLANREGTPRVYARLDTAAKDLRKMGLAEFAVNVVNFEPVKLRPARPDSAAQLRRAHAAAEHDAWFRGEVQKTLDKLARGEGEYVEHDALFADLARRAGTKGRA